MTCSFSQFSGRTTPSERRAFSRNNRKCCGPSRTTFAGRKRCPTDPGYSAQWHLDQIENAPGAWDINPGGKGDLPGCRG